MMLRPVEYYLVLAGSIVFVFLQHKGKPLFARAGIAGASGMLGFGLAEDFADFSSRSETLSVGIVTVFIYILLDLAFSLASDREFLLSEIKRRLTKK